MQSFKPADQSNYKALRSIIRERTKSCVAWLGAGLSLEAGFPSWYELRSHLTEELQKIARSLPDDECKRENAALLMLSDEENYWKAFGLLKNGLGDTSYRTLIRKHLDSTKISNIPDVYKKYGN